MTRHINSSEAGRTLGKMKSEAKTAAVRLNGKLGGRPPKRIAAIVAAARKVASDWDSVDYRFELTDAIRELDRAGRYRRGK